MNNTLSNLQQLYMEYISTAQAIRNQAPFAAWLLSPHKDSRVHPCHQAFYEAAGEIISQFPAQKEEDPEQLVRWILQQPEIHTEQEAYWYLIAALNHAKPIISLLSDEQRHRIGIWYSQLVPKRQRYPVQEEIILLLTK